MGLCIESDYITPKLLAHTGEKSTFSIQSYAEHLYMYKTNSTCAHGLTEKLKSANFMHFLLTHYSFIRAMLQILFITT